MDLHAKKDSHVSMGLENAEWHIRNEDMNMETEPGKNYVMHIPVVNTSQDEEANRFRKIGKPFFTALEDQGEKESDSEALYGGS